MTQPNPATAQGPATPPPTRPELRGPGEVIALLPSIAAAAVFLWFLSFAGKVAHHGTAEYVLEWMPALGISFAFRLDGLSWIFSLLISGIGALIYLYTACYFRGDPRLGRLLTLLVLFGISMLGLVLADDAITLFLFWEGTTITSFLLVGFDYEKAYARRAALQALLVTGLGGLALLGGLLILGNQQGTYRLSEFNAAGDAIRASALYFPVLALVLLAAFTKSAQFPFHFWLPGAMAAPTPVSAFLHSATMVKAGVYLLARLTPALGGTMEWFWTLTIFGAITMVIGSVWALRQTDLKLMLAHTTVMGLGALVMFLGGGTETAVKGAALFLVVHALYKASLFLTVGCIDKKAGTREVDALGGLAPVMPMTAAVAALAALSMAGLPPFIGFLGKEVMYEGAMKAGTEPVLVTGAALVSNAMMFAVAGIVAWLPFRTKIRKSPKAASDPSWMMWGGPGVLAVLGLLFGVFPGITGEYIVGPVTSAITGHEVHTHLALWHGVNPALVLSLATFALGFILFLGARAMRQGLAGAEASGILDADRAYDRVLEGIQAVARAVTWRIQSGSLPNYMRASFAALSLVVWGAVAMSDDPRPGIDLSVPLLNWAILGIILVATAVTILTRSRLTAICALGAVGSGVAIIFVLYSAIDVAMTQLMIEILVVVFFAIALLRLPRTPERKGFRVGDAGIAAAMGLGITIVLLTVTGQPLDQYVTDYYEKESTPVAFGHNIVNVILVDFRALDTMGEIAVIVIASIGAVAVLTASGAGKEDRS